MDNRNDSQSAPAAQVSHLDLMRLFDGEHREEAPPGAKARDDWELVEAGAELELQQLSLLAQLVRESVEQDERADSIADAVMARIEADDLPQADSALEAELGSPAPSANEPALQLVANTATAARVHHADVRAADVGAANDSSAANDNSRRIYALAAAAAAVAAGLFLWGQGSLSDDDGARHAANQTESSAAVLAPAGMATMQPGAGSEPAAAAAEPTAEVAVADDDAQNAPVEIAAVDFGRLTGSVFYVPGESASGATAVVWVTDSGDDQ